MVAVVSEAAGELVGGRYRLIEPVGQGGMGRVWRARDEVLDREVAVKEILLPHGLVAGQRDLLIRRVLREARSAARLNNPGIITVHDVAEYNGAPLIVMEFIKGRSLAAVIREEGRLPPRRVAAIGAAMLDALTEAHAAGIVHRDLKPDNVLLTGRRTVITDFGIASLLDATALTSPGTVLGTPLYMAPEQIEGRPATPACDLWSLGATLYAAVEGQSPFTAPTLTSLYAAILTKSPRPAEHAGPLGPILTALFVKDPGKRATADHIVQALAALLQPEPNTLPWQSPQTHAGSRLPATGPPATAPTDRTPAMGVSHPTRVAFEGARVFVPAANAEVYWWLSEMVRVHLGAMYGQKLAETRLRLQVEEASFAEAAAWRALLEDLLHDRPDLTPLMHQLVTETSHRLRA